MTATATVKKIHARVGLTKMPDGTVTPLLNASLRGLTDHADIFPRPPVELTTYQGVTRPLQAAERLPRG